MIRFWSCLAAVVVACAAGHSALAVVLASDNFNAEGGGTGFAAADNWGNLQNGASSTQVASPAFRALSPMIDPISLSSGSVYISFDFSVNQTVNWGGLAFFEGIDGGEETLFIGMPNGQPTYGIDLKGGQGTLSSGVPIDSQVHRVVAQIEFGTNNDTYRLWIDNLNQQMPNAEVTLDGFVVDAAWQSVRVASDAGAGTFVTVDNLIIADSPADVGLTSAPGASVTINRTTGEITLSAPTNVANVVGYSLRSNAGAFNQSSWNTIDGRDATDATPPGNGSVDNDNWDVLTDANSTTDLSEFTFDPTPGDGLTLTSTPLSLGNAWQRTPFEDVFATMTVDDNGTMVPLAVEVTFTGAEVVAGDFNGDGDINLADWSAFKSGQGRVNAGMTLVEAYQLGDMDGNRIHNLVDFDLFAEAYDAANGAGAFAAALATVPEPSSLGLLAGIAAVAYRLRRRIRTVAQLAIVASLMVGMSQRAEAVIHASDDFSSPTSGTGWTAGDAWEGLDTGGLIATHPNGGGNTFSARNFAAPLDATNALTYIRFTYRQEEGNGNEWGGFAFFEGLNASGTESFFAGPNPGGDVNTYAFDLKGVGILDSGLAFDNQFHTIIGSVDTRGTDTIYKIWVDNFDINTPTAMMTITGQGPIDAPWLSLRFQGGGLHEFADNLLITDGAEESLIFAAPPQDRLNIVVNKTTGEITLENNTLGNVNISAYSIASAAGALSATSSQGDFNQDGGVDAADYVLWRNHLGKDAAVLNGNGSGGATVTVDDYELWKSNYGNSTDGANGWQSLAERDVPVAGFPQGTGNGMGWEEGSNPSQFEVEEYRLVGESTVAATPISLGLAYGGGPGGPQDLVFTYRSNGEIVFGNVNYVTSGALVTATVPEPTSLALGALALGSLWFVRRTI